MQSAGPILIFCSENDELAPYQVVYNFAQSLQELGADVKLVKWNDSPHVGMYNMTMIDNFFSVSNVRSFLIRCSCMVSNYCFLELTDLSML